MSEAKHRIMQERNSQAGGTLFLQLARDKSGNVLPLAAAGTLVLLGLVGGGVDMARAYQAERRLQAACDAGVLAGRRAVTDDGFNEDTAAVAQAHQYFDANYDGSRLGTSNEAFVPVSPHDGNTVNGTATATLPTVIMRVFGFNDVELAVNCSASMGVGNSDIVFVVDNTYSMQYLPGSNTFASDPEDTRIYALKQAMMSFYDTVEAAVGGSNARIRYGFVPYANTVNVGDILNDLDSSYLANSITVPSVRFVNWNPTPIDTWNDPNPTLTSTTQVTSWTNVTGVARYSSDPNCQAALPGATAWTNYGAVQTTSRTYSVDNDTGHQIEAEGMRQEQQRTEYRCNNRYRQSRTVRRYQQTIVYEEREPSTTNLVDHGETFADAILQQRTFNVSTYKTFSSTTVPVGVNTSGTLQANYNSTPTWPGCIRERETTPASSFTFVSLLTGITPIEATDLDIDEAPTSDAATKWSPIWPQVTYARDNGNTFEGIADGNASLSRSAITGQRADAYCPYQARILGEMTELDFDTYVGNLETSSLGTYHDTGLLWGARISSPTGIFADNVNYEAENGGTVSRHVIFMTDGTMQPMADVNGMYGIESLEERITGTWINTTDQASRHSSRAAAICEAIKARGIRLWVIGFGTSLNSTMKNCASPDSWFESYSASSLSTTFQEIANQVGELRVTQ